MTTAIKTDLRREIIRILEEDINYEVQEDDGGDILDAQSIFYQKTKLQNSKSYERANQNTDFPGLVLCDPLRTNTHEDGGTNERDLWVYNWLIQLVDKDMWDNEGRIATWEKWIEQIVSALMFSCLNNVVQLPKGQIWWSNATVVSSIDEKVWVRETEFISGVEVTVKVLQPRGIIE